VTRRRAARIAGKKPPMKPIASAQTRPRITSAGVTAKLKATWVKPPPMVDTL
jgi:hypothetical protein